SVLLLFTSRLPAAPALVPYTTLFRSRTIVSDIISDDKRAGEVIQRLRDLLRKDVPHQLVLDLNALIRDVARLLSSDALIRNVTIDRKSTRLNSSHEWISYAVFCLKKK